MKHYLRFTLLLLFALVIGGGKAFAGEEVYKTLTFPPSSWESVSGYSSTWEATMGEDAWTIYGFNNYRCTWKYIKCGTSSAASIAFIKNKTIFDKPVTKVVLTIDAITTSYVNKIYLEISSDANFDKVDKTISVTKSKGDKEIVIPEPVANSYYRLVFDCAKSKSPGVVTVSKVVYYAEDSKTATTTTFSTITGTEATTGVQQEISATATVKSGDTAIEGATITYASSNEKIATVESNGTIKPLNPGTTKITATYAGDDTHSPSSAEFTLNVKGEFSSISDMQGAIDKLAENGVTSCTADLTFSNVYVTGVNGNNAYISDGERGMLIFTKGHGLTKGDKISGTAKDATLCLYNGIYEITGFSSTGLTITSDVLSPYETTISSITAVNAGKYVTVKNVTYNESAATFTDSDNKSIAYYDGLGTKVTLVNGNKYDVTGVVGYHNALQLMPTQAEALAKVATLKADTDPKTTIYMNETDSYTLTYEGDGTVSVESSDAEVATAEYNATTKTVTITPKSKGDVTITISATAGATYGIPEPISYDVEVTEAGTQTETFKYNDSDIKGQGTSGGQGKGDMTVSRENMTLDFTDAYGNSSYLQVYGSSSITITAKEGYLITGIKLIATSSDYLMTWKDQSGNALTSRNNKATWSGKRVSVTINNTNATQARFTSIAVSYIKLTDTNKTATIGEDGYATFYAPVGCIVGDGTVTKYITGVETNGTLAEVDAPILVGGEGVLLRGKAGSYKVYTTTGLSIVKNTDNKLVGCNEATSVPAGSYVMQKQSDVVAFYVVSSNASITCPAGKAYLSLPKSNEAKALFFIDSETTGIDAVETTSDEPTGDIYTLSGVKVNKDNLTKGIYIVNGKKFIVK